ncbi:hypothetical protein BELL_0499g00090 [Botrytis elliptica]|uniref:Zn(2)-C6 fungal-type domain-containing protein n=1 Tax=Botrytis elliptica TaxID=278938 RepID=A0A4Z1JS31_9HELO|nr:hypothetical protein EAE99_000586 [Botrytis elliptica]TGO72043.1 hypothetical protein BELL_0499g00090 [Botrytis elliptica]
MAASSRSSSYYDDMSNELYSSSFDDFQNDINESLDFNHVSSTDFYLGPEMFLISQMLGEQPYSSQHEFVGITSNYESFQRLQPSSGSTSTEADGQEQFLPTLLGGIYGKMTTEYREVSEESLNQYPIEEMYCEDDDSENIEYSRKKRRPSQNEQARAPSTPQSNVFKLDLGTPSISWAGSQPIASQESLSSVFEVNMSQQPKRKARSAFTPQGKKKVEAVRSVGACIQCKFRKRTCGTNEPCTLCIRRAGSLESAASLCTRESPFVELSISEFYSSKLLPLITDFDVDFSSVEGQQKTVKIDGKGPASFPLYLDVIEIQSSFLAENLLKEVRRMTRLNTGVPCQSDIITVLNQRLFSSKELEEWVMNYTDGNKIDNVNSTSFLFGVVYVKEKLPHADLVDNTTKLIAFSYMLCKGLRITTPTSQQDEAARYPVLRAQLETRLFNLLRQTEKLVYDELQRLVFKTSGQLPKDAVVPVALVLWLLTRLQSLKASHVISLSEQNSSRSLGTSSTAASRQKHVLNLLISVFTALFRSSFPLLMNFEDKCNRDLLGGNEDLIQLSKKLGRDLIEFKRSGHLKASTWNQGFLEEQVGRLRDLLTG